MDGLSDAILWNRGAGAIEEGSFRSIAGKVDAAVRARTLCSISSRIGSHTGLGARLT